MTTIKGDSGDNTLTSTGVADTLIGGAGNDTYIVNDVGDVVDEAGIRVDVNSAGIAANNDSRIWDISADRSKVLFSSRADNLVPNDSNGLEDVFVKDLITGSVTRVDTNANGEQATDQWKLYSIRGAHFSPDAAQVVFVAPYDHLVPKGYSYQDKIFIKDLSSGAITLVNTSATGEIADNAGPNFSDHPVYSADGKFIAFMSTGANLLPSSVSDSSYGVDQLYVKDLSTGTVTLASASAAGISANEDGWTNEVDAAFSPDGKLLAFVSYASNLVAGDSNGSPDLFVKNLTTGAITRVDTAADGAQADSGIEIDYYNNNSPVFSPDGHKILFATKASNLVDGDSNGVSDLFVKDLTTGAITRVSTAADGSQADDSSQEATFSADGSKVIFASDASNLISGVGGGFGFGFGYIKDLTTGAITALDYSQPGLGLTGFYPRLSDDGQALVVMSNDSGTNGLYILHAENGGIDTVQATVDYTLTLGVENLTLTGSADLHGTGNSLANQISGNSGNNLLDGGTGADTLIGGLGNDTYVVDNTSDQVIEQVAEGTDTIHSNAFYYNLYLTAKNVENLTITGGENHNATGNNLNNVITGDATDNILSGGAGADTLIGGGGSDIYVVDNVGDVVIDHDNDFYRHQSVYAKISYTLGDTIENLTLTGSANTTGTGNAEANVMTGNIADNTLNGAAGNDTLSGGGGSDTLIGGTGDDTYQINGSSDVISENAGEGTDTVQTQVSYSLYHHDNHLENIDLLGHGIINAKGNTFDNVLHGNRDSNILWGGFGADTMIGGLGNDRYVVDSASDVVVELAHSGGDTVYSRVSYTLGTNVENLVLRYDAIYGTGNALNNRLTGNSMDNTLSGGLGNDSYQLGRSSGHDTLIDSDATVGNQDSLQFSSDVAADQLWFSRVGSDLEIDIIGTSNSATIKDWYLGSEHHLELFKSGDGKQLTDAHVENLVSAMASLAAPPIGQFTLSTADAAALAGVFAVSWV